MDEKKTVYDEWKSLRKTEFSADKPWISDLPGDSDHSPFLYRLGISSMSAAFTYDLKVCSLSVVIFIIIGVVNDYHHCCRHLYTDSDHSPFLYRLGISSMSATFTYDLKVCSLFIVLITVIVVIVIFIVIFVLIRILSAVKSFSLWS